jgi:hypothetical protein
MRRAREKRKTSMGDQNPRPREGWPSRHTMGMVTGEAAEVVLTATEEMVVDEKGLIHRGFTFDYAAMLAVNHLRRCLREAL